MYNRLLITTLLCVLAQSAFGQYTLSGTIFEEKSKYPIDYATVVINDNELWTVTNDKGVFQFKNVPRGSIRITVICMGFAKKTFELNVTANVTDLTYYLPEENLTLEGVVVTAQNKANEMAGSYVMDRVSLEHIQMLNLPDVMSLLPGGQTNRILDLADTQDQSLRLRAGSAERGNANFGTAVVVDGVRLSNNASIGFSSDVTRITQSGLDPRNIASSNIESVEVITGIPSVVYGDMSQGVVKINTLKGKSPYTVKMSTNPHTKSFSLGKGFGLGGNAGLINANIERTKSIKEPMSPYTSYDRNNLSLSYDNTFNRNRRPLSLMVGLTGNIGGYNTQSDPDNFTGNYSKIKDNTIRLSTKLDYLPNLSWITNVEFTAGIDYSNKIAEQKLNRSSAATVTAIHGKEEGYFVAQNYDQFPDAPIVQIPPGYWHQLQFGDNKPLNINAGFKARLTKKWGEIRNNIMVGADFSSSGNKGRGVYFEDMRYAPSYREYRFDLLPFVNNLAFLVEDKIDWRMGRSALQFVGGIRSDMTLIKGSEYGNVSSLSPRINAIFSAPKGRVSWITLTSLRAGFGKFVKLPSLNILYPEPQYRDIEVFAASVSGTENYVANYILPRLPKYNPDLAWQYTLRTEAGIDFAVKGISVSLTVHQDKVLNSYENMLAYEPFSYKYTNVRALDNCPITVENRMFAIDQTTGIVRVSDKTGQVGDMELNYFLFNTYKQMNHPVNGSPILRRGLDWVVDFGKIPALSTSIRLDGKYDYYRAVDEVVAPYRLNATTTMADGNLYKYLGYYPGISSSAANGSIKKQVNSNLTFVTHIPAIRFIVSLRIETSLYSFSQNLSEYQGKPYGFVLDRVTDNFPSETLHDIYAGDHFVGVYPLYYVSLDDVNIKIPFAEALRDAYANDRPLYNELVKMIRKTGYNYTMNENPTSFYASANINLTKEIGNIASITFHATNFLNAMQSVKQGWTGQNVTLFNSPFIPRFYYGISLTLKL